MNAKAYSIDNIKILVLGQGNHGKGTFSKMLAKRFNLKATSSSQFAFPYIKDAIRLGMLPNRVDDDAELYEMRKHYPLLRQIMKELICLINLSDRSNLTKMILNDHSIYDGMRDSDEFNASWHLFDYIFYVDASERVPAIDQTMEITFDSLTMHKVDNNQTEYHLQRYVDELKLYNPEGELIF